MRGILARLYLVILVVTLVAMSFLALPSCAPSQQEEPGPGATTEAPKYTLVWSTPRTPAYPETAAMLEYEPMIEQATGGRVDLKIFHSGSLYGAEQTCGAIIDGSIDIGWGGGFYLESYDKRWNISSVPYLWESEEQFEDFMTNEPAGQEMMAYLENLGFYNLCWAGSCGYDCIWNNVRPIKTLPDDAKGLNVRVAPGAIREQVGKMMGFNPVIMAVAEVLTGLEQGTVSGVMTRPQVGFRNYKAAETCPYVTDDPRYDIIPTMHMINMKRWNGLPSDIQGILLDMFGDLGEYNKRLYVEDIAKVWIEYDADPRTERAVLTSAESAAWEALLLVRATDLCRVEYGAGPQVDAALALKLK